MARPILVAFVAVVCLCSCGMGNDDSNNEEKCPEGYTVCGSVCCPPSMVCASPGSCEWPYQTARLWVYLCPDFNDGCQANYFMMDQTCSPLGEHTAGSCYDTGFEVNGGRAYGLAVCQSCPGNCSNPVAITTPSGFSQPDYDSKTYWYCKNPCEQPVDCP